MSTHKKENAQDENKPLLREILEMWAWELLTLVPVIFGVFLLLSLHDVLPTTFLIASSFFIGSFTGIIAIVHREASTGLWKFRSKWVVLQGISFAIICWGLVLYVLINQ